MTLQEQQDNYLKKKADIELSIIRDGVKVKWYRRFAWLLIWTGVVVVVCTFYVFNNCKPDSIYWQDWRDTFSSIGGFIGGTVTACWSLAGLIFVYIGFIGQKNQLVLQQLEIEQNQLEQRLNTDELKKQNHSIKQQQLENRFFKMLEVHNSIVDNVRITAPGFFGADTKVGRDVFKLTQQLTGEVLFSASGTDGFNEMDRDDQFAALQSKYHELFQNQYLNLGNYLSSIQSLLNLIITIPNEERVFFLEIVKSHLSNTEVLFIFHHVVLGRNTRKLKTLIEELSVLGNINSSEVISKLMLYKLDSNAYKPQVFLPLVMESKSNAAVKVDVVKTNPSTEPPPTPHTS